MSHAERNTPMSETEVFDVIIVASTFTEGGDSRRAPSRGYAVRAR